MHNKLFRPAEALMFRQLPEQFRVMHDMYKVYKEFVQRGYASRSAFYFAFVLTHANTHCVSTDMGADEFYKEMTRLLGVAVDFVEHVIDRHLWPFRLELAFHETVVTELDPIAMLKLATGNPGPNADPLTYRLHFEAARQLGIALQLFSIQSVDPDAWVSEDLKEIERLSWERLFNEGASEKIWVVAELYPTNREGGRAKTVRVTNLTNEKNRLVHELTRRGARARVKRMPCRLVENGGECYYIYVSRRRKRLLSTLMKLERGRPYQDRRGWKYVVVAVRTMDGLRAANAGDAVRFSALTHELFWWKPIIKEHDISSPNPDSDERYADVKTVGRFEHADNGRIVAGPVEQLVTAIGPHIDTLVAVDGNLSHVLYASRKIAKHIAPIWFPHRRGPFERVPGFRLPGYGIAWNKSRFMEQLENWWLTQL